MARKHKIAAIIPCYKVKSHIGALLKAITDDVHAIYCVDDKCPDGSGKFIEEINSDERVKVIYLPENRGVGGAVLAGFQAALHDRMDIGVKLDGDGQMDPAILPSFVNPIIKGRADYTKGNRFYNPVDLRNMPKGRLIGNAILSFTAKFSTGYWNSFDPTNGYVAMNLHLLKFIPVDKIANRYFFETDLLFRVGLAKGKVMDIPMTAIYEDEESNLKFSKEAFPFMKGHLKNFFKRIWYNYFLRDFSVASVELVIGFSLLLFGVIYGIINFGGDNAASAGVVMMAALPILISIILLISFLNYDMQQTPRDALAGRLLDFI